MKTLLAVFVLSLSALAQDVKPAITGDLSRPLGRFALIW
jgi:hypothetical protein